MPGRIVYVPPPMQSCRCADKPRAEQYDPGTVWECDVCHARWVVARGTQYNEVYYAWRREDSPQVSGESRGG